MKKDDLLNRIEINPKIMFGKPVIKGSRLTVEIILEKLAAGQTEEQIISSYPFLRKEDIKACLPACITSVCKLAGRQYAAKVISLEELIAA